MLDESEWAVVDWGRQQQPLLTVVVDTEAEFDWVRNKTRRASGVRSVKDQRRAHRIYERFKVRPTYVLDYPVSSDPEGYLEIRDLLQSGACEIGAHLQPWDTPPFAENLSDRTSFPGNLPRELERAKLVELTRMIEQNLEKRPRIYKAGRYGVGPATAGTLAELGYEVDVSVLPGTDLRFSHGPDFTRCGGTPYWFGRDRSMLEIPMTIGFTGAFAAQGYRLFNPISTPLGRLLHVPGVFARLHLLDRITLTPEGITFAEQRRLTRALLARGQRVFSLTYHSPSLAVGNTPYVRSERELEEFLRRIEQFLEFFMGEVGGRAATPLEIKAMAEALRRPARTGT